MTIFRPLPLAHDGPGLRHKEKRLKKMVKRLSLHRETLGNLDENRLGEINGGIITDGSCVDSCNPVSVRLSCLTTKYMC
jgi:hypothetical protein